MLNHGQLCKMPLSDGPKEAIRRLGSHGRAVKARCEIAPSCENKAGYGVPGAPKTLWVSVRDPFITFAQRNRRLAA